VWVIYDTDDFPADIHRKEYWPKLADWLESIGAGEYTKGRTDMYTVLRPFLEIAIVNAKKLDTINAGRTPTASAPGTKVYELIEKLIPYLGSA
jgi:hypothetical protein